MDHDTRTAILLDRLNRYPHKSPTFGIVDAYIVKLQAEIAKIESEIVDKQAQKAKLTNNLSKLKAALDDWIPNFRAKWGFTSLGMDKYLHR